MYSFKNVFLPLFLCQFFLNSLAIKFPVENVLLDNEEDRDRIHLQNASSIKSRRFPIEVPIGKIGKVEDGKFD